jgi:ACS family hexuronate transporter-like MFS transporter
LRWLAISIFLLSNTLNFLDRQLLAALGPTLKTVLEISNVQYGTVVSAFSIVYAVTAPFAGAFVDRVGLNAGSAIFVGIWSLASTATGFVGTFPGLLTCRAFLGLGEAAALPLLSKANATYLPSSEWGLASAFGSVALTGGSIGAPLLVGFMSARYDWRSGFIVTGILGLIWVAVWLFTARRIVASFGTPDGGHHSEGLQEPARWHVLRDRRLWRIICAYPLVLMVFILWLNWTTIYLVQQYHLSQADANRYFAWLPPIFVALGGFFNGWLTFRWIRRGMTGLAARKRVCVRCAPIFVFTAATPFMPSAWLTIVGICVTMFACQSVVGSLNIVPIDLFGPRHAAFSMSLLASSFSLIQTFVSPLIGASVDRFGFSAICVSASLLPLVGIWLLRGVSDGSTRS